MQKFLVVSYDDDQQQWFFDFVVAEDDKTAVATVLSARPYVMAADATTPQQLRDMADNLESESLEAIEGEFNSTVERDQQCQNCRKCWREDELKTVEDIHERVAPGEPMPSGECPECGAVCHPMKKEARR